MCAARGLVEGRVEKGKQRYMVSVLFIFFAYDRDLVLRAISVSPLMDFFADVSVFASYRTQRNGVDGVRERMG